MRTTWHQSIHPLAFTPSHPEPIEYLENLLVPSIVGVATTCLNSTFPPEEGMCGCWRLH